MILSAQNIEKSYKGRKVVKGISIAVKQGEIVGLLGPNGAGKTTSFLVLLRFEKKTSMRKKSLVKQYSANIIL